MVQGNLDKDKDTKRKIIVIDDPVTSMDSSALFIVGALVREMIKVCTNSGTLLTSGFEATYIDQIFILTHNVLFHREVTMGQDSDDLYNVVSFFQINKSRSVSHILPCFVAEEDENGHKPNTDLLENIMNNGKNAKANRYIKNANVELRHALSDLSDADFETSTSSDEDNYGE